VLLRKKLAIVLAASLMLAFSGAPAAFAASNPSPSGTGQPSVECGDPGATDAPTGFSTEGFTLIAEHRYADSEDSHAVSQYDVACYQVTHKGGAQ
jgi:hypothetical protein